MDSFPVFQNVSSPRGFGLASTCGCLAAHLGYGRTGTLTYFSLETGAWCGQRITLDSKFAVSNAASLEAVKDLDYGCSPFDDDLLKVERVIDTSPPTAVNSPLEKCRELAVYKKDTPDSCFTPSYKTLVIPSDLDASRLKLVCRPDHIQLTEDLWSDPEVTEIDLPFTHLEALCLYVASRMLNPTGFAGGNGFHEGNNYGAKFEAECALLETQNLMVDQDIPNLRLVRNGWA